MRHSSLKRRKSAECWRTSAGRWGGTNESRAQRRKRSMPSSTSSGAGGPRAEDVRGLPRRGYFRPAFKMLVWVLWGTGRSWPARSAVMDASGGGRAPGILRWSGARRLASPWKVPRGWHLMDGTSSGGITPGVPAASAKTHPAPAVRAAWGLRAGFVHRSGKGSHRIFVHPKVARPVTVSGNPGDDAKQ